MAHWVGGFKNLSKWNSGGTDRSVELCYNFSILNVLTHMFNFPTCIPDSDSDSPALLDLFFSSDTSICYTMVFLPFGNSDHVFVSVSIDFPWNSQRDAPFHCKTYRLPSLLNRKTAEEIIIYAHRDYSLLLKLEKKKKKQSIIFLLSLYHAAGLQTPTSLLISVNFISQWEATQIWWLWRRHEHQTKFWEFIFEEMLAFHFNNFICIISLHIILLTFVQIPWPDKHMNNLPKCFYFILLLFLLHFIA